MNNKNIILVAGLIVAGSIFTSCFKSKNSPGYEYMPDMYLNPAYRSGEPHGSLDITVINQAPVDGTIAHGKTEEDAINNMPYPYANDLAGLEAAALNLKNPLKPTKHVMENGQYLFGIYCSPCHGKTGKGDGSVVKVLVAKDNYGLQPSAFDSDQLKGLSEGQIFHATQYGKNNMGPYAQLLSATERWSVVYYVQTLQGKAVEVVEETTAHTELPQETTKEEVAKETPKEVTHAAH